MGHPNVVPFLLQVRMKRVKQSAEVGFETYEKTISKVRSKKWSTPLAKTMSFTGHILKFAGKGVPFVGILGSALTIGSKVINPDPTLKDIIENSEII